jgi:tRNA-specific adenosine deaminase 3
MLGSNTADPTSRAAHMQVLASAAQSTSGHPLQHAAMAVIAAMAERDRRLWPGRTIALPAGAPSCGNNQCTARKQPRLESSVDVHTPARVEAAHGDGVAAAPGAAGINAEAAGTGGALESGPMLAANSVAAAVEPCEANGIAAVIDDRGPGPKPYLCTGFDCYLVREPCVMCAMALVHSRVRRVMYAKADPKWGALGGSLRLHGQRSLNHHYTVYHMPRTRS